MSDIPADDKLPGVIPKPPGTREFSIRAVVAGVVVAAIMGASYPYIVLKLGFGPNVSVVAAFFGFVILGVIGLALGRSNRWENNIVQTAGTSAAQTAFMCVILAAFDFLELAPPSRLEAFFWLFCASILGILLAVPLRKHYVEDPNLTYADGVAAAETVVVLDSRGKEARTAAIALFAATALSAIGWLLTTKWGVAAVTSLFGDTYHLDLDKGIFEIVVQGHVIPEVMFAGMWGLTFSGTGAGFAVSLLAIGSGMIVGNRVNISMAAGGVLAWIILPKFIKVHPIDVAAIADAFRLDAEAGGAEHIKGIVGRLVSPSGRRDLLLWMMWPGTGMLIAAGLTALFIKWRTLQRSFSTMSTKAVDSSEFPLAWVGFGVVGATIALVVVEWQVFDLEPWYTLLAVALSVPLMLVGLRVLGETNWGPISQLTNMMQAVFAAVKPHDLTANLATSGTTGTIAVQSEAIIQDYKCGHIIGSTPKFLTYSQLIAAPIGAAAVAIIYPVFKSTYGVGSYAGVIGSVCKHLNIAGPGDVDGLSSPISVRIAGFARVLNKGFDSLPPYALEAMVVGVVLGILIALGEVKWRKFMPSATGLGIGMMVPGNVVFTMVLGGILMSAWSRVNRRSADQIGIPLASGLIAGEALMAIMIPALIGLGLISP